MKILLMCEKGRNVGNKEFNGACDFQRSIYRQFKDIDVVIWGLNWSTFSIPFDEIVKDVDVIVLLENYDQSGWVPDLSKINKLKMFWTIDSHMVLQDHIDICNKQKIDIPLVVNWKDEPLFTNKQIGRKSYWLPSAYPSDLLFPLNMEKEHNIGFCGNVNNRGQWLRYIQDVHGGKIDVMRIGQDMGRAINSYKIHFNRNIHHEVNGRTFETPGCGTFLLTNDTFRLKDLFEIGKHIQTYYDVNDLNEKIKYYLEHEDEREVIAKAGHEHAFKYHTYDVRAKELIRIIKEHV